MIVNFAELSTNQVYQTMTQTIIPRPIAWVLTDNGENAKQAYNLAPYSYFTAVSSDPALVMISVGKKPEGEIKDTRVNLKERKHCVIHIAHEQDAQDVTDSAATLAHGESEVDKLGIELIEVEGWPLPRIARCPVAMQCSLYDLHEIGPNKQGIIFCQVHAVYVDDSVVGYDDKQRVKIDAKAISPLSRLGASEYASFGEVFTIARPK